jgi:hypothetical protein
MPADPRRVALAILGLMLTGAAIGGVLGALLLVGWVLVEQGTGSGFGMVAFFGGGFGALIGAIMAPIVGLLVLPSVPLWRALLETGLGTLVGGAAGFYVPPVGPIVGGVAGFVVAAVRLRVVFARRRREGENATAAGDLRKM